MPYRWVLNPVVLDRGARKPKVSTLVDPGRPFTSPNPPKTYLHSSVISRGRGLPTERDDVALSLVQFVDPVNMDSDSQVVDLLNKDFASKEEARLFIRNRSPQTEQFSQAAITALRSRFSSQGANVSDFDDGHSFWDYLMRLAQTIQPARVLLEGE